MSGHEFTQLLQKLQTKLVKLRQATHPEMTDRAFEEGSGISREYVRLMEGRREPLKGKRGVEAGPTLLYLSKYVEFCGKDLEWLFCSPSTTAKYKRSGPHPLSAADTKIHDKLQDILDHGGNPAEWISGNLVAFHKAYCDDKK